MAYKFSKFQRAWLTALRSGKFRQTERSLGRRQHKHVNYCCLGVACAIANRVDSSLKIKREVDHGAVCFDKETAGLPEKVQFALGLHSKFGALIDAVPNPDPDEENAQDLVSVNDNLKWNFKQIADYIEKNPTNVFKS